jgi:hypothetical protein
MLKDLTYHCYENFNRKYDEHDEKIFNETAKENLNYIIQTLKQDKTKLDIIYVAALLTSKLSIIESLCEIGYFPNDIPNIMNVAAAFSDYKVLNFFLGLDMPLTTQVFNEAVNADRYNLLNILYFKNCPIDYEETLYIVTNNEDTESSYYWLQDHIKETEILKSNELYKVLH